MSLFGHFAQNKTWRSTVALMGVRESCDFVMEMTFAAPASFPAAIDIMNRINAFDENPAPFAGTRGAERHETI